MSLLRKTSYTALATAVTTCVNFLSQFLLYPVMVSAFGAELFGIYTIINKASNFMSAVDLRPSACLRYIIAKTKGNGAQALPEQNRYISATVLANILLVPVFLCAGLVIGFVFPHIYVFPAGITWTVRICILIVALRLSIQSFAGIPQSVIRGNNLEYKLWWINIIQVVFTLGLIILLLKAGCGLIAVISAPLAVTLLVGGLEYLLMRKLLPRYSLCRTTRPIFKSLFGHGIGYLLFSLAFQLYQNADILLLGYIADMKTVAVYTISKSLMFRCGESASGVLNASTASIGFLLGKQDFENARKARHLTFSACCFVGVVLGGGFILLNKMFIGLWIGDSFFVGSYYNNLLVMAEILALITTSETIVINSSLNFMNRFFCFMAAVAVQIAVTFALRGSSPLTAIVYGVLAGRTVFFAASFGQCNRILRVRLGDFLKYQNRILWIGAGILTGCLCLPAPDSTGWLRFTGWALLIGIGISGIYFRFGFPRETRQYLAAMLKGKWGRKKA